MSIQEIVSILTNSGIEPNEANIEVKMLIEHFCNYSVKDVILGKKLSEEKLSIVKEKAEYRAKTKLPIQYIIGKAYFMGSFYNVDKNVLIPRDETELLVRRALELIENRGYNTVLDIGTGTGCIACTIANNSKCNVEAVDISLGALKIAILNADEFGIKNIKFTKSDLFENLADKKFDLIISNPPYIPKTTKLQEEVEFEPHVALFASGKLGTEFYEKIISDASKYLNDNGILMFELGINQSEIVKEYFKKRGFSNIVIENDLAGIPRVIYAELIR